MRLKMEMKKKGRTGLDAALHITSKHHDLQALARCALNWRALTGPARLGRVSRYVFFEFTCKAT